MPLRYVIIGAGPSGRCAALELGKLCPDDEIVVFSDESLASYYRPALPSMLCGEKGLADLNICSTADYERLGVTLCHAKVEDIDPDNHEITIRGGRTEKYDRLLLACGARPYVHPNWPGRRLEGIHTFRKIEDVDKINSLTDPEQEITIVGGGIQAMEMAESLVSRGFKVTMIVREFNPGVPLFNKPMGAMLKKDAIARGIKIRTLDEIAEFIGNEDKLIGIRTRAGGLMETTLVLVSIGVISDIRLGREKIEHSDGYLIDENYRTSAQDVFAAGDAALRRREMDKPRWRHWQEAGADGVEAARCMAGQEPPADRLALPLFGRIVGRCFLILGREFPDVNSPETQFTRNDNSIAYVRIREGKIREAALLGYRHCHHPLAEIYKKQLPAPSDLDQIVDINFDWERWVPTLEPSISEISL
jgi:NADPH-dependent 2,4-dienoyl-CoA reductase/sulfur reductase-like enzyme